jgi:hypothetical protein
MPTLPAEWLDRRLDYRLPMLRGTDVRVVQLRLLALGFLAREGADGLYGPNTRRAVRAFQEARGLAATGIVAEATMAALMLDDAPEAAEAPPPPGLAEGRAGFTTARALTPVRRPTVAADAAIAGSHVALHPPALLPADWLPPAKAKRVICHWTGGNHRASSEAKEHYHVLIEGDGTVVRGRHSIADNDSCGRDDPYAAHTRGKNTGSIGVAVCCMFDAKERPFSAGPFPMTEVQWRRMAEVVAQLCQRYRIAVTPETVLAHGEVGAILGVEQRGKWDPLVLPWAPEVAPSEVGERFRRAVAAAKGDAEEPETPRRLPATIAGVPVRDAASFDCALWVEVKALTDDLGWRLVDADGACLTVATPDDRCLHLQVGNAAGDGATPFVRARDVASQLGLGLELATDGSRLDLRGTVEPEVARDGRRYRPVTIAPDDTLRSLAARLTGEARRWREILGPDGRPFDDEAARRLEVGSRVLVPLGGETLLPAGGPDAIDRLTADLVEAAHPATRPFARQAVPILVTGCLANGITTPAGIAYVLATAEHETHFGRWMEEIWGPTEAQRRYDGRFGNDAPGDGKRYKGRGYVQITFKENYRKFRAAVGDIDLVADPGRAADPDIAATIAVVGMRDGTFTGRKLADYLEATDGDFVEARRIINADIDRLDRGHDVPRGQRIALQARAFTAVLARHLST